MFEATENNVIFVNFHYDEIYGIEPFGKKELLKKIYDSFVNSEKYKNSLDKLSSEEKIEKTISKLKAEARSILLPSKYFGALVGAIPFVDWYFQKFIINKNAVKKVGELFGIDAKFIDEDNKREIKLQTKKENTIYYTIPDLDPGLDDKINNPYVVGDELTKQSDEYIYGKAAECTISTGGYTGGIALFNFGLNSSAKAGQLVMESTQYTTQAAQLTEKINNMGYIAKLFDFITKTGSKMTKEAAELGSKAVSTNAASVEAATKGCLCKSFGGVLAGVVGFGLGVGMGLYATHQFCEETIDKFVEYFKKNVDKINNSYIEAAEYFLQ
jgi:hypothetical protein